MQATTCQWPTALQCPAESWIANPPSNVEREEPEEPEPGPANEETGDNDSDLALGEGDELDSEGRR